MPSFDTRRLYSALLNTGLQRKDNALYQVIYQLIGALAGTQSEVSSSSGSGGGGLTTQVTNIYQILGDMSDNGGGGEDGGGPPGPPGIQGLTGATGPAATNFAFIYEEPEDVFQYPPIVGPQGNPGTTGAQGPIGTSIISDDSNHEENYYSIGSSGGAGKLVQVVNTQTGTSATGTTVMPSDNTIPQNTEGTEFMTLSITPTSATNKLKIEVVAMLTCTLTNNWMIGALFQDSTANAIAAQGVWLPTTAGVGVLITFIHYMTTGITSSTTFKFRAGQGFNPGTVTFNGAGGAGFLGGVIASSITISEIIP